MAFPLMTGFLFSALTLPWNLLGHVDLVVEVNEGVTDGSNVHNSARIEGSSGAQVPSLAKSVPSSLLHVCQGRLALQLSAQEGPESCFFCQELLP